MLWCGDGGGSGVAAQFLVDAVDIVQQLLASSAVFGRGDEVRGQLFPLFGELFEISLHVGFQLARAQLVGFGEDAQRVCRSLPAIR